ncbi:MAG TPA: hypothetical protein VLG50_05755 [Candidatus Saccharimonadales bacterium]|nr:hypothetical protein [Candidatus Saccharimonadales bacterium]
MSSSSPKKQVVPIPGPIGPTGPTGLGGIVDEVRALAGNTIPDSTPSVITGYYTVQGNLSSSFNATTGIFTAPVKASYLVTLNVTWQDIVDGVVLLDDGNRSARVNRSLFLNPEPAFIGQDVSVVLPQSPTGPFYATFNTKLSASGVFPLDVGNQIRVTVYQDNSNHRTITAFVEWSIVKIKNLGTLDPFLSNSSPFTLIG